MWTLMWTLALAGAASPVSASLTIEGTKKENKALGPTEKPCKAADVKRWAAKKTRKGPGQGGGPRAWPAPSRPWAGGAKGLRGVHRRQTGTLET